MSEPASLILKSSILRQCPRSAGMPMMCWDFCRDMAGTVSGRQWLHFALCFLDAYGRWPVISSFEKASCCPRRHPRFLVENPLQLPGSHQDDSPHGFLATHAGIARPAENAKVATAPSGAASLTSTGHSQLMKAILLRILQIVVTVGVLVWVFHDREMRTNIPVLLRRADPRWLLLGVAFAGAGNWPTSFAGRFFCACKTSKFLSRVPRWYS